MKTNGNGSTVSWTETEAGKQVQARLAEPRILEALDHLLDRIGTLEQAVEKLSDIMQQGPGMIAMVGDMADETYRQADAQGISIDERLKNALALAERLTAPEMVAKLDRLIALSDQIPGLAAMLGDMTDETYRQADARGVNIDQRLGVALQMAEKLTEPDTVAKLEQLLQLSDQLPGILAITMDVVDEGIRTAIEKGFNPQLLARVAGTANTALTESYAEHPVKSGGIFSLLRALSDPDRQKAMGFFLNFLKHFGHNL